MHAGTRIVKLTRNGKSENEDDAEEAWTFKILARFQEHQSMNYGSDVQPQVDEDGARRVKVVSTSFYDRLLCLWEWQGEGLGKDG